MKRSSKQHLMLIAIAMLCIHTADAKTGVCYGTLGDNLLPPRQIINLCKRHNIGNIRIYNPNPAILKELQGTNISVIVGVPNDEIQGIATDPSLAKSWVQNNIHKYQYVNFRYISVGNEMNPSDNPNIAPYIPTAMQHISDALEAARLRRIKVSAVLSMSVIGVSYPPSAGAFRPEFRESFIDPIIKFLLKTHSVFLIDVYPYFAYASDPTNVPLDYALFTSKSVVVRDGAYKYQNLFHAMVDSVHAALEKAGGAKIKVVVTETGWPTAGGVGTTVSNAFTYNSNLFKSVTRGTPRRPRKPLDTYIFDLIDENQKTPELERHWGIFLPNNVPKYHLSFTA
ncbi:glucan endo-1,3-beta-glucosidase, basic isoform-like [Salvia divinorum]|uniref:Glucan endo-1,3-beta-glucosidase, basic isoform-like n=1 Tax=Salvia divinorum TaxID=28513 RepID=A0ABD1IQA5_SALDI